MSKKNARLIKDVETYKAKAGTNWEFQWFTIPAGTEGEFGTYEDGLVSIYFPQYSHTILADYSQWEPI